MSANFGGKEEYEEETVEQYQGACVSNAEINRNTAIMYSVYQSAPAVNC